MFVILAEYRGSDDTRAELLAQHHEFLDAQYRAGRFLASGPAVSRPIGVILASGEDEPGLRAILDQDPFVRHGVVEYDVIAFRVTRTTDPGLTN